MNKFMDEHRAWVVGNGWHKSTTVLEKLARVHELVEVERKVKLIKNFDAIKAKFQEFENIIEDIQNGSI